LKRLACLYSKWNTPCPVGSDMEHHALLHLDWFFLSWK
jgi:hypothetical protein